MPMFNYRCGQCKKQIEEFVKKHDDVVICDLCGVAMKRLLSYGKFTYKPGDFFEPYVDTDIHPEGKPIRIENREQFFSQCRKYGRGWRKISDKMR